MPKVERKALEGRWLHSHEEDGSDTLVFRPSTYRFPRTRQPRSAIELRPDGTALESEPGPADRSVAKSGRWSLQGSRKIALRSSEDASPHRVLEIVSAGPDRLVVKK